MNPRKEDAMKDKNKCLPGYGCAKPKLPQGLKIMMLVLAVAVGISCVTVYNAYSKIAIHDDDLFVQSSQMRHLIEANMQLRSEVEALKLFRAMFKTKIRKVYHLETKIETRPVTEWTPAQE